MHITFWYTISLIIIINYFLRQQKFINKISAKEIIKKIYKSEAGQGYNLSDIFFNQWKNTEAVKVWKCTYAEQHTNTWMPMWYQIYIVSEINKTNLFREFD